MATLAALLHSYNITTDHAAYNKAFENPVITQLVVKPVEVEGVDIHPTMENSEFEFVTSPEAVSLGENIFGHGKYETIDEMMYRIEAAYPDNSDAVFYNEFIKTRSLIVIYDGDIRQLMAEDGTKLIDGLFCDDTFYPRYVMLFGFHEASKAVLIRERVIAYTVNPPSMKTIYDIPSFKTTSPTIH